MKTTRHDLINCPVCHEELDASTDVLAEDVPASGDVTLCIYCGSVLIYGDGLQLTQTWDPEILDHPKVVAFVEAWLKATGNG